MVLSAMLNKKRILIAASVFIVLIGAWFFTGFYKEREWGNLYVFIKHRPTAKFMFYAPRGEADPSPIPGKEGWLPPRQEREEAAYEEFVENHGGLKRSISIPPILSLLTEVKEKDGIVFYAPYTDKLEGGEYPFDADKFTKQYNIIRKADPTEDAQKAIADHDFRFIGISGYAYIIPGIENGERAPLVKKFGFKIIAGTSDSIDPKFPPLQSAAYDYAKKYNSFLSKQLQEIMRMQPDRLIGLTVSEAIRSVGLELKECIIFDEPPGVARGVSCKLEGNQVLQLFITRDRAPFSRKRAWNFDNIESLEVIQAQKSGQR